LKELADACARRNIRLGFYTHGRSRIMRRSSATTGTVRCMSKMRSIPACRFVSWWPVPHG